MQILGISANTKFSQQAHAASLELPYPLLSDYPDMRTIESFGVRHPQRPKTTVPKRYYFLVDMAGVVRGKWQGEDLEVFPSEILLEAARQLSKM